MHANPDARRCQVHADGSTPCHNPARWRYWGFHYVIDACEEHVALLREMAARFAHRRVEPLDEEA